MKKAMIFAAGLGSRLRPLTNHQPKALVNVADQPLLEHCVEHLVQYGVEELVINVHHFAKQLMDFVEEKDNWGLTIHFSDERDELLETGGGLLKAKAWLQGDAPFVVINADILSNINLAEMLAFHQQQQAMVTLAVRDRESSRKLLFSEDSQLAGWRNEKTDEERWARRAEKVKAYGFSGIQIIEPAFLELIEQRGKFSIIEPYLQLAAVHKIVAYPHDADYWFDVGKPHTYESAQAFFASSK